MEVTLFGRVVATKDGRTVILGVPIRKAIARARLLGLSPGQIATDLLAEGMPAEVASAAGRYANAIASGRPVNQYWKT